jgi:hypothetical protein
MRYEVKKNRVAFGWEDAFKDLNGIGEEDMVAADVDFMINTDSVNVGEIIPTMAREQPWYINNPTRLPSNTYEGQHKYGEFSLSGPLKRGHLIDAVIGGAIAENKSTYDEIHLNGGDRKSLAIYFDHGIDRTKNIIGIMGDSIDVDATENENVKFTFHGISAKAMDGAYIADDLSAKDPLAIPPFHWKHVTIRLSLDGGNSFYTYTNRNFTESCKISTKNSTVFKYGGNKTTHADYYLETTYTTSVDITLYPEDDFLWRFATFSNQAQYANYPTLLYTIHYDGGVGPTPIKGATIYGVDTDASAIVLAVYVTSGSEGFYVVDTVSGDFKAGEAINSQADGLGTDFGDVFNAYQELGLEIGDGSGESGLVSGMPYKYRVNGVEYTVTLTTPNTLYTDLIAAMDTAMSVNHFSATLVSGDIRITADDTGPSYVSIADGSGNNLFSILTGFIHLDDSHDGLNRGKITLDFYLERPETDDFIKFYFRDLVSESMTESFEAISKGVDPVTAKFVFANKYSRDFVLIHDSRHDNSYSAKY